MLTGGRKCVILRLIDDHSRYAVASHVASGETAQAAIIVFDRAVTAHGASQRLLSDNGIALNPSRRGLLGQLVVFHQTLFRCLDRQPLADTLAELHAQVDAIDHFDDTERPHHGLPGRITPAIAWESTEVAKAPRPTWDLFGRHDVDRPTPPPVPTDLPDDTTVRRLNGVGVFMLDRVQYKVDGRFPGAPRVVESAHERGGGRP